MKHLARRLFLFVVSLALQPLSAADPTPERTGPASKSAVVIAFGDSITQGYGLPAGAGWVELLGEMQRKKHGTNALVVVNAGVGGQTSTEGLNRMPADVLARKPALVLVEFGGNDAVLGARAVRVEDFRKNLLTISNRVRQQGGTVMFLTFPPVINEWHAVGKNAGYDAWGGLDQCVEQYRQQTRAVATLLGAPLLELDGFIRKLCEAHGRERYLLKDGVHLTVEANRLWAEEMMKILDASKLGAGASPRVP